MRIFVVGMGRAFAPAGIVCFLAGLFATNVDVIITGGLMFVLGILAWLTPLRSDKAMRPLALIGLSAMIGGYLGIMAIPLTVEILSISKNAVELTSSLLIVVGITLFLLDIFRNRNRI